MLGALPAGLASARDTAAGSAQRARRVAALLSRTQHGGELVQALAQRGAHLSRHVVLLLQVASLQGSSVSACCLRREENTRRTDLRAFSPMALALLVKSYFFSISTALAAAARAAAAARPVMSYVRSNSAPDVRQHRHAAGEAAARTLGFLNHGDGLLARGARNVAHVIAARRRVRSARARHHRL